MGNKNFPPTQTEHGNTDICSVSEHLVEATYFLNKQQQPFFLSEGITSQEKIKRGNVRLIGQVSAKYTFNMCTH